MSQGSAINTISAVVGDTAPSYLDGEARPLSTDTDGRLRVSVVPAPEYMEFFVSFDFGYPTDIYELSTSPWSALS